MRSVRLGFHHDTRRCTGCRACVLACQNHHLRNAAGLQWREVYAYREEPSNPRRHFLSVACNHCGRPECVRVCPTGAAYQRSDGVVLQEHARCEGCRLCLIACPYRAPRYSDQERKVSKCDLCVDRLDAGLPPVCVMACLTDALSLVDLTGCAEGTERPNVPGFPAVPFTDPSVRFTVPKPPRR